MNSASFYLNLLSATEIIVCSTMTVSLVFFLDLFLKTGSLLRLASNSWPLIYGYMISHHALAHAHSHLHSLPPPTPALCVCVFIHVSICHGRGCTQKAEVDVGSHRTRVRGSCELPQWSWELNFALLKEQRVFLATPLIGLDDRLVGFAFCLFILLWVLFKNFSNQGFSV